MFDRFNAVTLHQLRVLSAVATTRNFARAAEALSLSQPAVSAQIHHLEQALAVQLLDRAPGRRHAELTEAGRLLVNSAAEVFRTLDLAERQLSPLRGAERGMVAVGADLNFGGYVIPRLYADFRADFPAIEVRLVIDHRQRLLEALRQGQLDLAVVLAPIDDSKLLTEPLAACDWVLVGPSGHRLARVASAPFRELAAERLILSESTAPFRPIIRRMAAETETPLHVVLEVADIAARIHAVLSGIGVAPLGIHSVTAEVAMGRLRVLPVEGFPVSQQWLIASSPSPLSASAQLFKEHLLRWRDEPGSSVALTWE